MHIEEPCVSDFFARMPQTSYQGTRCATMLVTQFHRTGFLSKLAE